MVTNRVLGRALRRLGCGVATISIATLLIACVSFDPTDPVAVVERYFAFWNTEDIEGVMSMLADEPSIEVDIGRQLTDRDAIRAAFEDFFARSDFEIVISDFESRGNSATYNYDIVVDGRSVERGRSEATVEDGRIKSERLIGEYRE